MVRNFSRQDWQRAIGGLQQSVPGLGVSLLFHAVILLIMAWIVFRIQDDTIPPLQLGWSTIVENDGNAPAQEATPQITPIVIPSVSMNASENEARPRAEESPQVASTGSDAETAASPPVRLVDVSQSLSLRRERPEDQNDAATGARKGTGREAIADALKWLASLQESDGRWRLNGNYADAGTTETDTGATALALLAFLGDGQTHVDGIYQSQVYRGLEWLRRTQRPNGDFFDIVEEGREAHFYAHAQATIAFCEALALTQDENLRGPAERGAQFLESSQNPALGGWKYRPLNEDGIGDLSVTGWALMALHSARMANIEVDYNSFLLAERFLNSVQEQPSSAVYYKYRPDFPAAESQRLSMTAEGLLCRQWLGWPRHHLPLRNGIEFLMIEKNLPEWKPQRRNVYAWYYVAQALHNYGGPQWEAWYQRVLPLIVENQQRAGREKGSWHPNRPPGAPQERSRDGGRLYLTVMCVLILQTPYRHAPLYDPPPDNRSTSSPAE